VARRRVGAIIDKVKELGIEKDTLIVFVSDHGSWRHGKTTLHDFGMRVPMLCLWPGTIRPGTKI
jgi:arylsulfatase A-like enzyme